MGKRELDGWKGRFVCSWRRVLEFKVTYTVAGVHSHFLFQKYGFGFLGFEAVNQRHGNILLLH